MDSKKQLSERPAAEGVKKKPVRKQTQQQPYADSTVLAILASKRDKAKRIFIEFGPGRTINKIHQAVIDATGPISGSSLRHWCSEGKWLEAANAYDLKAAEADHAVIAHWKDVLREDPLTGMELARALQIEQLVNASAVMKPQDKKALSQTIKDLTTVIETLRSPTSSMSRDKSLQSSTTSVTVRGDVHIHQNRAIAVLDKIEQQALAKPDHSQVIDVTPKLIPEPSQVMSETSKLIPDMAQPALQSEPVVQKQPGKPFLGVEIHKLAELANKDRVSFAEALEKLKL